MSKKEGVRSIDRDHAEWEQPERTRVLAETLGPAIAELNTHTPGARAFKTALAVGIAWWLASLLGEPRPIFAAIGALVGVEVTILASLRRTGLQLTGIAGGIGLAVIFRQFGEITPLMVGLAVFFGLWLGRWLRSPNRVGVELGVTTLLVVTLGHGDPAFAASRLWETALGGLVATTTNALIMPPSYLRELLSDLDHLADEVTHGLVKTMHIFAELPDHEGAAETFHQLQDMRTTIPRIQQRSELAAEALRFSPLTRNDHRYLERCRSALFLYRRASAHAERTARVVQQHAERPHSWSHDLQSPKDLLKVAISLAQAMNECQVFVRTGEEEVLHRMKLGLGNAREELEAFFADAAGDKVEAEVERFVDVAAIASELDHLVKDVDEFIQSQEP